MVFDHRTAEWGYDFMVEQDILTRETDRKKRENQIRKISGWCSKIRVQEMGLPLLHRGLTQPPDILVARERWDELNPRPSDEILLSGNLKFTPADYSDLDLGPSQHRKIPKEKVTKSIKSTTSAKPAHLQQSTPPETPTKPHGASSARENQQEGDDGKNTQPPPVPQRSLDEIREEIRNVPVIDKKKWEQQVLLLKIEIFTLHNDRPPEKTDLYDIKQTLPGSWRDALKREKERSP